MRQERRIVWVSLLSLFDGELSFTKFIGIAVTGALFVLAMLATAHGEGPGTCTRVCDIYGRCTFTCTSSPH